MDELGFDNMNFKLETPEMDLGNTPIENIFINDYMPMANGTYVKVYLIGFKYAYEKDEKLDITNSSIAKHLDIPLEDVLGAWDFWEEKGIVIKHGDDKVNYKVEFLSLKQLYVKNNCIPSTGNQEQLKKQVKSDTEDLLEANQIPIVNNMFNQIDYAMRRQTTPSEKKKILNWMNDYNMGADVIEMAFYYAVEGKGIRKINYVEGIIKNWYDEGLTHIDAVTEKLNKNGGNFYRNKKIMKSLGLENRPVREDEEKIINKWFGEYDFPMEIVLEACERDKTPKPSVEYVNKILESWYEKGVKTVEDIGALDKDKVSKGPSITKKNQYNNTGYKPSHKNRFHNFEQRSDKYTSDQLEEIARKKRKSYNDKLKGEA